MMRANGTRSGFTLLEVCIATGMILVVAGISLPILQRTMQSYRISGNAKGVAHLLMLAKIRAASNFTIEAVVWDSTNSNTFSTQYFKKNLSAGPYQGQLQADSSIQPLTLSNGISHGQPPSLSSTVGADNSSSILFNSRGLPIDNSFNPITASQAFYFNNGTDYYAVSVSVSGTVQTWKYVDSAWVVQ